MNSASLQNTEGGVTLKPLLPLDYRRSRRSSSFRRTRPCPRLKRPKAQKWAWTSRRTQLIVFLKECSRCVTTEKSSSMECLNKMEMKDFITVFLFPPVCQKPTPPTGREMNSPSAVIPESPLLFLIKTFLRLCSFFSFFFFYPPEEVWGWVNNLLLTGHTMIPYILGFHRLQKKKKKKSLLSIVVWCWPVYLQIFCPFNQQKEMFNCDGLRGPWCFYNSQNLIRTEMCRNSTTQPINIHIYYVQHITFEKI